MPARMRSLVNSLNCQTSHIWLPGIKSPATDVRPAMVVFGAPGSVPRVDSVVWSAERDQTCQRPCLGYGQGRSGNTNNLPTFELFINYDL